MKNIWVKTWPAGKIRFSSGICLYDWGLPLHFESAYPNAFTLTLLCFYVSVDWSQ
ncbi:hypothetical protein ES703_68377 [subsurface metagenome]